MRTQLVKYLLLLAVALGVTTTALFGQTVQPSISETKKVVLLPHVVFAESNPSLHPQEPKLQPSVGNSAHEEYQKARKIQHRGLHKKPINLPHFYKKATAMGKRVPYSTRFDGEMLDTDPGVAPGTGNYLISYTGDYLVFRDKSGNPLEKDSSGGTIGHSFYSVFVPALDKLNQQLVSASLAELCDPYDVSEVKAAGCINVVYDGRVFYDPARQRFWLLANSRHNDPDHGNGIWRFPVVAVSKTEDPTKGFYTYVPTEEYADWPKFAVFEDYVLVGHHYSPNILVLDANAMAKGDLNVSSWKLTKDDFDCDVMSVVKQHNRAAHMAVVVGTDNGDDDLHVFGLLNPTPGKASKPLLIDGGGLDLDVNPNVADSAPILRNGNLHLVWQEKGPLGNWQVRHVRVPIMKDLDKPEFNLSDDPGDGYRETIISGDPAGMLAPSDNWWDILDYVKPTVDVAPSGAAVVVWAAGNKKGKAMNWEIRYSVHYGDEPRPRPVSVLQQGDCGPLPNPISNGDTHVDLSTAQSDAGDHASVWIAHARARKTGSTCWFGTTIGRIKP